MISDESFDQKAKGLGKIVLGILFNSLLVGLANEYGPNWKQALQSTFFALVIAFCIEAICTLLVTAYKRTKRNNTKKIVNQLKAGSNFLNILLYVALGFCALLIGIGFGISLKWIEGASEIYSHKYAVAMGLMGSIIGSGIWDLVSNRLKKFL